MARRNIAPDIYDAYTDMLRQFAPDTMSNGQPTGVVLLGYINGYPVYGRVLLDEEHINWFNEIYEEVMNHEEVFSDM